MATDGLVTLRSANDFKTTLDRLLQVLKAKGVTVFAQIDHAAGAAGAGLALRPTMLVLFGNPAAGTHLMQTAQTASIDLPLKALIWQGADDAINLSYNDPAWIAQRHKLAPPLPPQVASMTVALQAFAAQATSA
jgi:uncharacterized protein (DUF302 family)